MNVKTKRCFSLLLAVCMLATMMFASNAFSVSAEAVDGEVFADFEGESSVPSIFGIKTGGTVTLNTEADYAKGTASLQYVTSSQFTGFTIAITDKPANCVGIAFDYYGRADGWGEMNQSFRVIAAKTSGFASADRVIDDQASDTAKQHGTKDTWVRLSYDFREMYKPSTSEFATDYASINYLWFLPGFTESSVQNYMDNFTYLLSDGTEVPSESTTQPSTTTPPVEETGHTVTYYQAFEDFDSMTTDTITFSGRENYACDMEIIAAEEHGSVLKATTGANSNYYGVRFLTSDYAVPAGCVGFAFDFKNVANTPNLGVIIGKGTASDTGDSRLEINTSAVSYSNSTEWRSCEYKFGTNALSKISSIGQIVLYYPADGGNQEFHLDNFEWIVETSATGETALSTATAPSGKVFAGWKAADGKLYNAGDVYNVTADTSFEAVSLSVQTQEGAGVRWAKNDTERGLRFETYVNKAALDTIGSSSFTIGTLILPAANYDADLSVEGASSYEALNVVDEKVYSATSDKANYRYYGAVVDMEKYFGGSTAANELELAAVGYVGVKYADGETKYFYSDFDAEKHVRCAADVANAALADEGATYTDKQIEILKLYCPDSLKNDTTKAYRTDAQDFVNAD